VSRLILLPAIDLKQGQCVRLNQGRFDQQTVYGTDPVAMARHWQESGAEWIHLINLDGSIGNNEANLEAIKAIVKSVPAKYELGGGIRTLDDISAWLTAGVDRLILGTAICETPDLVKKAADLYPGKLAASLDSVGLKLKIRGWLEDGGQDVITAAGQLKQMGISLVIHTDVERDGTQKGPNLELAARVAEASDLPTLVAGGISGPDDLRAIKKLNCPGIIGAISGRAVYEGTLTLAMAQEIFL
jgi:phosphoribosylformimino-5-aminoimidazole carboxamide ribotide isomerase